MNPDLSTVEQPIPENFQKIYDELWKTVPAYEPQPLAQHVRFTVFAHIIYIAARSSTTPLLDRDLREFSYADKKMRADAMDYGERLGYFTSYTTGYDQKAWKPTGKKP